MSNENTVPEGTARTPFGEIRMAWGWMLALGILMVILGLIGLAMDVELTIVAVWWFGVLAVIAGVMQLVHSFQTRGWNSALWHVLLGAIYLAAGFTMILTPLQSAYWLTVFLAAALVAIGVMRIVIAFRMRDWGRHWLWVLLMGIASLVLGALIYATVVPPSATELATPEGLATWVRSWGWVIGMFIAIEFLVQGFALISIAFAIRRLGGSDSAAGRDDGQRKLGGGASA